MWWGLTSALDLLNEIPDKGELNVLLIAQGDARHTLQTIAKKYTHPACKTVKMFIYEPRIENIARSMLLTTLALDEKLGLGPKTSNFLDLYGNSLIRQSTWQYLHKASERLTNVITNVNYAQTILPLFSFGNLKYKERDHLENIFKYWSKPEEFDILTYWNQRVRTSLSTRYDSRAGVFDWDLHMRYRPHGAEAISNTEYKRFREKGISFLQDDTDPCITNVTLAHFTPGSKTPVAGYFGDIETGPFPAFSLDCEDKEMLKKVNGQIRKSATDLAERNLQRMFHETRSKSEFVAPPDSCSDVIRQDCSEQLIARKPVWGQPVLDDDYLAVPVPGVEIIFLPENALRDFPRREQFQNIFDLVVAPQHLVSKLPDIWIDMCKNDCRIVVESLKFVLSYRKEDLAKAKTDLDEDLKDLGAKQVGSFDAEKDEFIRYKLVK